MNQFLYKRREIRCPFHSNTTINPIKQLLFTHSPLIFFPSSKGKSALYHQYYYCCIPLTIYYIRPGFLNHHTTNNLGQIIFLTYVRGRSNVLCIVGCSATSLDSILPSALRMKNVSRHCQVWGPGVQWGRNQNHPWLRTTALEQIISFLIQRVLKETLFSELSYTPTPR